MNSLFKMHPQKWLAGLVSLAIFVASISLLSQAEDRISIAVFLQLRMAPLYFLCIIGSFYLTDIFFLKRKYLLYIASVISFVLIAVILSVVLTPFSGILAPYNFILHLSGIVFVISIALYIRLIRDKVATKVELLQFKAQQSEVELKLLRQQINPHFLFNTLNSIYLKVIAKENEAGEMVLELAEMLRYQLEVDKHQLIPIGNEIEFLNRYLFFERRRLPKNVTLDYNIQLDNREVKILPNILITLIENTFKHGVVAQKPCNIAINISLSNKCLIVETKNSISSYAIRNSTNLGLVNLTKRLQFCYENRHELTTEIIDNNFIASLTIHL